MHAWQLQIVPLCVTHYVCVPMYWNISLSRLEYLWLQLNDSQLPEKWTSFIFDHVNRTCSLTNSLAFSFSLPLSSKDYWGAHRQMSLILHLGRPYTLLLHILYVYTETVKAHRENCGFNMNIQGTPTIKERHDIASIGSTPNFHHWFWFLVTVVSYEA